MNRLFMHMRHAPRRDLLPQITRSGDTDAFGEYISAKVAWKRHPLVYVRLFTYHVFSDLTAAALRPEVARRLYGYLLDRSGQDCPDVEFRAIIFLLNRLKRQLPLHTVDECDVVLRRMMAVEDRVLEFEVVDRNIPSWFCHIRNFLLIAKIRRTTFEGFSDGGPPPEDRLRGVLARFRGEVRLEKRVMYQGERYWIWRAKRKLDAPACTPTYMWAVVENDAGRHRCFSYWGPPEPDLPTETIVKRIAGTEFRIGDLHEIA